MLFHIVGARPQFIKLAPVLKALLNEGIASKIVHTGQHYDYEMNEMLFADLGLPEPDYHLGIGSGSHAKQTAGMLTGIEGVLLKENPDIVIVYGDTNTTLAGALAASKLNIPVAHVEAGLRSYDRRMPEEINRIVADRLSDYLFCPTENAVSLLAAEGMKGILTGDVMVDALVDFSKKLKPPDYNTPYCLATIHRAENTDDADRFMAIWESLKLLSQNITVVFPVHPRTRKCFPAIKDDAGGVIIIDPVDYTAMLSLTKNAACVITDSGGLVKEAFLLKTPCVTVRTSTEWPETVEAGANILADASPEAILMAVDKIKSARVDSTAAPFGDGKASVKIAEFLRNVLQRS